MSTVIKWSTHSEPFLVLSAGHCPYLRETSLTSKFLPCKLYFFLRQWYISCIESKFFIWFLFFTNYSLTFIYTICWVYVSVCALCNRKRSQCSEWYALHTTKAMLYMIKWLVNCLDMCVSIWAFKFQLKRFSVLGDLAFPQCFPSIDSHTLDLMPTLLIQRV